MSRESVLLRLLAQQIASNPSYNMRSGVADDIDARLRQSFETLDGKPMFRVEGKGYITDDDGAFGGVSDFVNYLRDDAPYFFNADTADTKAVRSRSDLRTPAERAKWIGEHGANAYLELPADLDGMTPVEKMKAARRASK